MKLEQIKTEAMRKILMEVIAKEIGYDFDWTIYIGSGPNTVILRSNDELKAGKNMECIVESG